MLQTTPNKFRSTRFDFVHGTSCLSGFCIMRSVTGEMDAISNKT